ncbi:MAG: FAD-dependent thymidylate synthase [Kiritimatiellae bacterium]|nr:FAD-dependent thymidylate synthase [Kiritimatiellia bacterium]
MNDAERQSLIDSGKMFKVLDDGFVRLVDTMGGDSSIVQAARVSYGAGTKKSSEDRDLIRYLLRHQHTTPFEMCEIKLHVRVPMDCWRQWIRHRTANVNEYSTRYSLAIDSTQRTKPNQWRIQASNNKQGSDGIVDAANGALLSEREARLHAACRAEYTDRIAMGIAREQARKDLPLSTYTEAYWKIDLNNLLHFLALRMEANAQYEIREYAKTIGEKIVSQWVPMAWEAFCEYRMNAVTFSKTEQQLLSLIYAGNNTAVLARLRAINWIKGEGSETKPILEAREFLNKLADLKIDLPLA